MSRLVYMLLLTAIVAACQRTATADLTLFECYRIGELRDFTAAESYHCAKLAQSEGE